MYLLMQISHFNRLKRSALILVSVLLLSACQIESEPKSEFEKIQERGVLRVGTLNNQLSYYIGSRWSRRVGLRIGASVCGAARRQTRD